MSRKVKLCLVLRGIGARNMESSIRQRFEGPKRTSTDVQAEWVGAIELADVVVTDDLNMVAAALGRSPLGPCPVVYVRAGDAGHVIEGGMVSTGRVLQSNFPDVVAQVLALRDALDLVRDLGRQRTFSVEAHG